MSAQLQPREHPTSLGDRMRAEKTLSNAQIDKILRGVLEALRKMHGARPVILHGAITPDAIVIDDAGAPTLLGAESTKATEGYRTGPRSTAGYAPIEQVLGRAGPSSDLYSLAMSVVAAATLREPGSLPLDERAAKIDIAKALPKLEPRTRRALEAMLEPVPKGRVDSASGVIAILDGRGGVREWTAVIVGLVAVTAISFLVLAAPWRSRTLSDDEPPRVAEPKKMTAHDVWAAYTNVTADLDGDGTRDVVGRDHSGALFAVSGKTGELLWQTSTSSRYFAVGDEIIVGTPEKAFEATAFAPKTGRTLWQKKLADEMYSAELGKGCVVIVLKGDQRVSFGNDGAPKPCQATPPEPSKPYRNRDAPLVLDGITLLFADVGQGTSRLGVERVAPGGQLGDGGAAAIESFAKRVAEARHQQKDAGVPSMWNVTLDVASEQPKDDGVSLTPSGLLLSARDREKNGYHVFLLDPDTGATKKHTRLCGYVNVSMPSLERISRELVKVQCEGEIAAIDEATLEVKWTAGRPHP
jgi:hypothetical protein